MPIAKLLAKPLKKTGGIGVAAIAAIEAFRPFVNTLTFKPFDSIIFSTVSKVSPQKLLSTSFKIKDSQLEIFSLISSLLIFLTE